MPAVTSTTREITHRQVWLLAGPMIISNISVPLVGAVDTAVVGHLPELHHIGAVALGALIFSFLYWGFGFLKMGITGYIARAYGAEDNMEISRTMLRFMALGLGFGLLVIIAGNPLVTFALWCIDSTPQVESLAADYALIRIWSAPAILCVYVFTGIFVGLHNTRMALMLQLVLNLINIALDLLFVPVFEWGVAGVAWATLIAEYSAALFGLYLLRYRIRDALRTITASDVFEMAALKAMMHTNFNIFIRTICLVFSFAYFTAQSAKYGELILAVNSVLLHLQSIMAYGLDGFAHAVEALGGSAYGGRSRERFKRAVAITTWWSGFTALFFCLLYLGAGTHIVGLFSDNPAVLSGAHDYLIWMIVAPIASCWSFQLDGIFIGTGHTREMRNAMLASTTAFLVCSLAFQGLWGNHGLFFALFCFMIIRAFSLILYYPGILNAIQVKERA